MLGMHGTKAANLAVQECDLLIAVGARFDDRVTGKLNTFAPHAKVIHLDIDPAELNKLRQAHVALTGDLNTLLPALQKPLTIDAWRQHNQALRDEHAWRYDHPGEVFTRRCCSNSSPTVSRPIALSQPTWVNIKCGQRSI
jgi:acetolactate synthase-1/2/3 large subunit